MRLAALALALAACTAARHHGPPPPVPVRGPVGASGGTVGHLFFGIMGDTRPGTCDDLKGYPTATLRQIVARLAARAPQFAIDVGDHMNVCSGGLDGARAQMAIYTGALQGFPATWFMTMGNHECSAANCAGVTSSPNLAAFLEALAPVSARPFYSFDVRTAAGLARVVVVADNAWDATEAAWLERTLADADAVARYTIVTRHHPMNDARTDPAISATLRRHKHALWFSGHLHTYKRDLAGDPSGRAVILGTGGAPLQAGAQPGYALVEQQPDGTLTVAVYASQNDSLMDRFAVGPN